MQLTTGANGFGHSLAANATVLTNRELSHALSFPVTVSSDELENQELIEADLIKNMAASGVKTPSQANSSNWSPPPFSISTGDPYGAIESLL